MNNINVALTNLPQSGKANEGVSDKPTHYIVADGTEYAYEKEVCCPHCEAEGNVAELDTEQDPENPFYYCYCYLCERESMINA
jgi:predicted  nucleic acid-binding Zn ribbon protein